MGLLATVAIPGTSENKLSAVPHRENPCRFAPNAFYQIWVLNGDLRSSSKQASGSIGVLAAGEVRQPFPQVLAEQPTRFH